MAPNPIVIPRGKGDTKPSTNNGKSHETGLLSIVLWASTFVELVATLPWNVSWRWIWSGCAIESILLIFGSLNDSRIFTDVSLGLQLILLNGSYAVSFTSWHIYIFAGGCYGLILVTILYQFESLSSYTRIYLRKLLRGTHFIYDKVARFDLPALRIDTTLSGLFVVRAISFSFSDLTIVAHGLELSKFKEVEPPVGIENVRLTPIQASS